MSLGVEQALVDALRWRAKQCRIAGLTTVFADLPESVQAALWGIAAELDAGIEAIERLAERRHAVPSTAPIGVGGQEEPAGASDMNPSDAERGGSGFAYGPGFKAWAKDFPPGTTLVVTARVELPAPEGSISGAPGGGASSGEAGTP